MTEMIKTSLTGVVKFYREDDGWGFIQREGSEDEFFHVRNLQCTPPYEGEQVVFDVSKSTSLSHDHEAINVGRKNAERHSGDILEWEVEPGTWRSRGVIAPHDGGDAIHFSRRDFRPAAGKGNPKPRPWHAATYVIADTPTGPKAVDIELDIRYPLQRFAYLGREEDLVLELKKITLDEDWDYRRSLGGKESPILYNYLHFTFAKLCDEDRNRAAGDKKIRTRNDIETPLAAFNTGLVEKKYKSAYALFEGLEPGRSHKWKFRAFCIPGEGHGKLLASYFNPLPGPAQYFHSMLELLYDPDKPLHPDYTHILTRNRDRLPAELLAQTKGMDESRAMRNLSMHLDESIEVAKKRARWNFRTAIPHYFPSFKRLEFLLPLCLIRDNKVDVALSVQQTDTGYLGSTIMPLDWAYKSARLVSRPDSDWLAAKEIDEYTQTSEEGEPE